MPGGHISHSPLVPAYPTGHLVQIDRARTSALYVHADFAARSSRQSAMLPAFATNASLKVIEVVPVIDATVYVPTRAHPDDADVICTVSPTE